VSNPFAVSDPIGAANPLATPDQRDAEALGLRLFEAPEVRAAREQARAILLADPVARTIDGRVHLERALDLWLRALVMRETNADPARPRITWAVDNAPHEWFGCVYPGAGMGIDNPDNIHREIPICGDSEYEITGCYSAHRTANFSFKLEVEPADHAGIDRHLFMLTTQEIVADERGRFLITLSRASAEGRRNHIQIGAEPWQTLWIRDSRSDWAQTVTTLSVRRTAGPDPARPRTESEIAERIAGFLPAYIRFWSGFKNGFLDHPAPNKVVGPIGRQANWGFLAGGRYHLAADEALVVTTTDGGARYRGFQVTDPWTMAPDPVYRQSSLNTSQQAANSDGSTTFVVSQLDPGVHNWIDTVGLSEGWFLLRWQGFPGPAGAEGLVRDCRVVPLGELPRALPAGCPQVTLAQRREQVRRRIAQHALCTATGTAVQATRTAV